MASPATRRRGSRAGAKAAAPAVPCNPSSRPAPQALGPGAHLDITERGDGAEVDSNGEEDVGVGGRDLKSQGAAGAEERGLHQAQGAATRRWLRPAQHVSRPGTADEHAPQTLRCRCGWCRR